MCITYIQQCWCTINLENGKEGAIDNVKTISCVTNQFCISEYEIVVYNQKHIEKMNGMKQAILKKIKHNKTSYNNVIKVKIYVALKC